MSASIDQGRIIQNVNQYLERNGFSIRFDEGGVCQGLAMMHAKYCMEDREADFWEILKSISHPSDSALENAHIFITQVLLAFAANQYNQNISQDNSFNMLKLESGGESKAFLPAFSFALVADDRNWANCLKEIALDDNEIAQVSSIDHAITISKKNGQYHVYDPEYPTGQKSFSTELEVLNELHKRVFSYETANVGLQLHLFRKPDASLRQYPAVSDLYERYLPNVNATATVRGHSFSTLRAAASINFDPKVTEYLLRQGADDSRNAAKMAINANNTEALSILLTTLPGDQSDLLIFALTSGKAAAFELLMKNESNRDLFRRGYGSMLFFAAEGGNGPLLKNCLEITKNEIERYYEKAPPDIKEKLINEQICRCLTNIEQGREANVLSNAIKSGDSEAFTVIWNELKSAGYKFQPQDNMNYLVAAIKNNNALVVSKLVNEIPRELLETTTLSQNALKRVNNDILVELKDHGVSLPSLPPKTESILSRIFLSLLKKIFGAKEQVATDITITWDKQLEVKASSSPVKSQDFKQQFLEMRKENSLAKETPKNSFKEQLMKIKDSASAESTPQVVTSPKMGV
ncbi:hypothetical protein [Legionella quinlivanii]|uniref:hypothetical protein n=1 Tax=Legionella quinlivanii TaxID=45073 RepID=UPI0022448A53|nr:hypothetical protein [Legionella quinlivanii]MCW8450322.1 hypothetical protein [Legionella quinlivanii]